MTETLEQLRTPLVLLASLTVGLQAGTYFTWATGVMPGLARVDDATFVEALQQVNVAIVNPVFLATFVGAPVLTGLTWLTGLNGINGLDGLDGVAAPGPARPWALAAFALTIATVVVTVAANVPLNDALAAAGHPGSPADLAAARADFEGAWVRWNVARAVTSAGALGALSMALVRG